MNQTQKSAFKGKKGIHRIINAWNYSCEGLAAAWGNEAAFRQITIISLFSIILALILPLPLLSKALLVVCSFFILIIELFNSAIEAVVDYISLDYHPLAKRAKDMASAAQMIGLINLASVWIILCTQWF